MDRAALADRITRSFDQLPGQLGAAARYVLDNPGDVALLSMREQARRAGVQPWTMTRLAKRLGFEGYEELRQLHGAALKEQALGFSGKAGAQVARQKEGGSHALARDIAAAGAAQVAALAEPETLETLVAAARTMADARRIYCFGLRSSHAVAAHFAYAMSFLGEKAVLLDFGAGTGLDALRHAQAGDVFFVTTVAPYTRASIEAAEHARSLGLTVVALTDSPVSPIAALADHVILAATESPSFLHTMTPAFAAAEILAALVAGAGGEAALAAIGRAEKQLSTLKIHLLQPAPRAHLFGKSR
ncbi:MurR/RpiR family transcriptional regulator [Nitratireductor sp. ZSWI3]|uniref:MurR/RpiR family transcriptional regulator n=1 Tax=Nitratireductor sp. ZSWI3 TaxID=2966359 RepID=UPI00215017F9|nr:MurR/RpiR family transcriptional regulator [Nitratireductor sp. ZSWI3]MCR4268354.1 MurR/RpiR family transcriptional regulator [Nitratireductor sp. ZSWI3]